MSYLDELSKRQQHTFEYMQNNTVSEKMERNLLIKDLKTFNDLQT